MLLSNQSGSGIWLLSNPTSCQSGYLVLVDCGHLICCAHKIFCCCWPCKFRCYIKSPAVKIHLHNLLPGPPQFFVPRFLFSVILITYDVKWTQGWGGCGPHSNNMLDFIIKCSVARQDPRHSQDYEYSIWLVRNLLSGLLCGQALPPPHIHLASTSHDKCFQAFPMFFTALLLLCGCKPKNKKKQGRSANEASVYTRWWKAYSPSATNIIAPFVSLAEPNQTVILCCKKGGIGVTVM